MIVAKWDRTSANRRTNMLAWSILASAAAPIFLIRHKIITLRRCPQIACPQ
jgi:hypothetical protein